MVFALDLDQDGRAATPTDVKIESRRRCSFMGNQSLCEVDNRATQTLYAFSAALSCYP